MSNVEFEDQNSIARPAQKQVEETTFFSRLLISVGVAKNNEQAQKYLLGATVIIALMALAIFLFSMAF